MLNKRTDSTAADREKEKYLTSFLFKPFIKTVGIRAFTLIELLVVIAIIGLLSSVVLASLSGARERAKISRAQGDLSGMHSAIQLLINDTDKYPGGCIPVRRSNTTLPLNDKQAGLVVEPDVGPLDLHDGGMHNGHECEWTSDDVTNWDGPYINAQANFVDPWNTPYYFDGSYTRYGDDCTHEELIAVIYSRGPTGESWIKGAGTDSPYTCDDIWVNLEKNEL